MNWAAISTVTVLLFLFGLSVQVSGQVETLLNQFASQFASRFKLDYFNNYHYSHFKSLDKNIYSHYERREAITTLAITSFHFVPYG